MLLGYWDSRGFDDLFSGDASTQTADVNYGIASAFHYTDYCLPIDDDPAIYPRIRPDLSEPPSGDEHPDHCLADFMGSSQSRRLLRYGNTSANDIAAGILDYCAFRSPDDSAYHADSSLWWYGWELTWDSFRGLINMGAPVILLVDSQAPFDGKADHAVAAFGYGWEGSTPKYICWDTWYRTERVETFGPMRAGQPFGVWGAVTLDFGGAYVAWRYSAVGSPMEWWLSTSTDGGQSFTTQAGLPPLLCLQAGPQKCLYMLYSTSEVIGEDTFRQTLRVARSDDGGATFGTGVKVAESVYGGTGIDDAPWGAYVYGVALVVPAFDRSGPDTFSDVLMDFWASEEINACFRQGVVRGYNDGSYQPDLPVSRDQMAVYIARALARGEDNMPEHAGDPSFLDVPDDSWAYDYIEYVVDQGVVQGYPDGSYQPEQLVSRDQMAVYIARSIAIPTGEAGLADYTPPDEPTFPDVPNTGYGADGTQPFWAFKYIEYCAQEGVVGGYADGTYQPQVTVTRDQMAVYITRAFELIPRI